MVKGSFQGMAPDTFRNVLLRACDRETSADPQGWTPENPLWGHCAVASLVAQSIYGGSLLRASLEKHPKFAHMRSHYWNRFVVGPSGKTTDHDFTSGQFVDGYPIGLIGEERTRAYLLSNEETAKRYRLLTWRFAKAMNEGNALFEDRRYKWCFLKAMESPCQKMRFGAWAHGFNVLEDCSGLMGDGCNDTIAPLKSLCDPTCIRLGIASRTDAMVGACGHAEELALWAAIKAGNPVSSMYVVGVHMDGSPWLKEKAEHHCLRCAVQLYHAGVEQIYVPVVDHWEAITPAQAIETAKAYATREKSL